MERWSRRTRTSESISTGKSSNISSSFSPEILKIIQGLNSLGNCRLHLKSRPAVHHFSHTAKRPRPTLPALHVPPQRAERRKLARTVRLGAPIHIVRVRVAQALQVLAELLGPLERRVVAQGALVRRAVPHALRRPPLRHVVLAVRAYDEAVQLVPRHARRAGPRLEVPRQRGRRDERPPAACARAAQSWRRLLVHARVGVLPDVVRAAEEPVAFRAEVVHVLVMLLELPSCADPLF